ncbi:MAG: hypothetical protein WEB88_12605 [Gemmatimonadota bacterium]
MKEFSTVPPAAGVETVLRRVDGCTRSNSAMDVIEIMAAMDLAFMPVVTDYLNPVVTGAVSMDHLSEAIRILGSEKARVVNAPLLRMPIVGPDAPLENLAHTAGDAPAYIVAQDERLIGIYEPRWRQGITREP